MDLSATNVNFQQSEDFLNKSGSGPQENSKDFNETSIFLEVDRDTSEEFTKSLKKLVFMTVKPFNVFH